MIDHIGLMNNENSVKGYSWGNMIQGQISIKSEMIIKKEF